jgi:uncharacterized membrane protein YraQ (UPF0718 family)
MLNLLKKVFINLKIFLPILAGIFLIIDLGKQFIPENFIFEVLATSKWMQIWWANILGCLFFSNAAQSYILGGEFLKTGVSLLTVTSFMVSWVTVGLIHFPLETNFLGRKFAIIRNLLSFIFSFGVAILTVFLYQLII